MVTCRYCGGKSLALIPDAVPRYTVRLGVSREQALEAATQCLRRAGLPQALREGGRIQEAALCYVPFYEAGGTRLGRFLLRQQEKPPAPVTEGKDEQVDFDRWRLHAPKETQDTRVVRQDYIHIGPACDLPELGVDRIRLEELRRGAAPLALEDFDLVDLQRGAVVFSPVKPPAMLVEEVERRIPVPGDRTTIVERRITLLYYPSGRPATRIGAGRTMWRSTASRERSFAPAPRESSDGPRPWRWPCWQCRPFASAGRLEHSSWAGWR